MSELLRATRQAIEVTAALSAPPPGRALARCVDRFGALPDASGWCPDCRAARGPAAELPPMREEIRRG